MNTMQFRGYVFPCNPQNITVSAGAQIALHHCPGLGEITQDMGRQARVVRCKGSFFGASAQQAMAYLREFCYELERGRSGMLFLPGFSPFPAYLEEFTFDAQGDGKIIPYAMTFREAGETL